MRWDLERRRRRQGKGDEGKGVVKRGRNEWGAKGKIEMLSAHELIYSIGSLERSVGQLCYVRLCQALQCIDVIWAQMLNAVCRLQTTGTRLQVNSITNPFHSQPNSRIVSMNVTTRRPIRPRYDFHPVQNGLIKNKQESPANATGTRDSSACMKAHC